MIDNESVSPDCPLRHTARITLVLSNLCPYRHMHAKCPASKAEIVQILPTRVVQDVLRTAAAWGWGETGTLAWHMYNEPTADPRLVHFCWMAKALMPHVDIHLWTNGWYLDHGLASELSDIGVTKLVVSTYSKSEADRLVTLRRSMRGYPTAVRVWRRPLDDRIEELGPPRRYRPCHAPLYDLTIYPTGHVGLCCMDWRQRQSFGDLNTNKFADVMAEVWSEMAAVEKGLERKQRNLAVCRECRMRRPRYGYRAERKKGVDTVNAEPDTGEEGRDGGD